MTTSSCWSTGIPDPDTSRETARQARALPAEPMSRGVRTLVAGAVVVWLATVIAVFFTLPERVPTHWSGSTPDNWSSRGGALAAMIIGPVVVNVVLAGTSRLVLRWPQGINAPNKKYWVSTPARMRHLERLLREDMALIGAVAMLLFAAISVMTGVAARRPGGEMPGMLSAVIMTAFVAGVLTVLVRMLNGTRYRGDEGVGQHPAP